MAQPAGVGAAEYREVVPFQGLGELRFGMARGAVRALLGPAFRPAALGEGDREDTDLYDDLGLHLAYDPDDRLAFIETVPPSRAGYRGIVPLGKRLDELAALAALNGGPPVDLSRSFLFDRLGLALYVPHRRVESVAVYPRGYYDDALADSGRAL